MKLTTTTTTTDDTQVHHVVTTVSSPLSTNSLRIDTADDNDDNNANANANDGDDDDQGFYSFGRKTFGCKSLNQGDKTGLQITLYNLTYTVPARNNNSLFGFNLQCIGKKKKEHKEYETKSGDENAKKILLGGYRKLCCTIDPGHLVALMGASGAGKTTLLDVICHRKTVGQVEGLIIYDGRLPSQKEVKRDTGYVEQFETLWTVFTVKEMLLYTAMLGMSSKKYTKKQKKARVDEVIVQLGLKGLDQVKCGNIRTGEAKKVSVAIGLLNNPRALFLDEPTTGLDSATAHDVMALVKALAEEGRTVLVTLHQPSGQIFDFFNTLVLLSRDIETRSGNIVYFGRAQQVREYFESEPLGYRYDPKVFDNVPEYFTDIISGGVRGPQEGNRLMECYEMSDLCDANTKIARDLANYTLSFMKDEAKAEARETVKEKQDRTRRGKQSQGLYANTIPQEIGILLRFKGRAEFRDVFFLCSRVFVYWVSALLVVTLYADTPKTPMGAVVVLVLLHIVVLTQGCMTIMYIPELLLSKPAFIKETHDGLYRVLSYCVSRLAIEGTSMVFAVIGYASILYWSVRGFMNESVGAFFFFMLTVYVFSVAAQSVTFALCAPSPSIELAIGIVAIYMLLNVAVIGFLNAVPPVWGWFTFISIMRWGWDALMINNFADQPIDLCRDVPVPLTTAQLVDTLTAFSDLESVFNSPEVTDNTMDLNSLVCGVLNTAINEPKQFLNETCPRVETFTTPATLQAFRCDPRFINLVTAGNGGMTEEQFTGELGNILLNFFPVGTGYDAHTKLINMSKWECLGYLALIWLGFAFVYYFSSVLSLRLVKR